MTVQCGTVQCVGIYLAAYYLGSAILHSWQKNGGQQKASLNRQMLQTAVVLNQFEGDGASFPPVATPKWRLQAVQVP